MSFGGANSYAKFMLGAAQSATPTASASTPTPASFTTVTYGGHYISGDPNAQDDKDDNEPNVRREYAARSLYSLITVILHATPPFTALTVLGSGEWARWFSLIITLAHLVIENPIQDQAMSNGVAAINGAVLDDLYFAQLAMRKGGTDAAYLASLVAIAPKLFLPPFGTATETSPNGTLPRDVPSVAAQASFGVSGTPTERWALYATLIYIMGRPPVGGRVEGINKRMKNLADKGNRGNLWASVGGTLRASSGAFMLIGMLWEKDGRFRAAMFRPLIGYARKLGDMNETMMSTIVGLLPMSQMAHVRILMDFLAAFEFVASMPELQAELSVLSAGATVWAGFPPLERPYAKMLWRDQFKAFDSKQLVRIVKLAVDKLAAAGGPTGGYAMRGADQALSDAFDTRRRAWEESQAPPATGHASGPPSAPAGAAGAPGLP